MRPFCRLALPVLLAAVMVGPASAATRHHHRHRVVTRVQPPLGPEESPVPGALAGQFGGTFETGILGASEADPYERSGYGYLGPNYHGPGYGYPGY